MSSPLLPAAALADWCRSIRHQLAAGVSVTKILAHATGAGPPGLRAMSVRLQTAAKAGRPLAEALDPEQLPPVFVPLFRVGEEAGRLPEILADLEEYLRQDDRRRRQFRQQTLLPRLQLFLAIVIVAGLIWILGAIAGSRGTPAITIFGLSGSSGALIFLLCTLGPIVAGWLILKKALGGSALRSRLEGTLLKVPIVGPTIQAIGVNRFAFALQHTLDSNLPIAAAVRLSFDATGSEAFRVHAPPAIAALERGKTLTEAIADCPVLPAEFIEMIASSEHGGTVPEMMKHQAQYYQELASERLTHLGRLASYGVWLVVATFIVICIFRIANIYLSAIGA